MIFLGETAKGGLELAVAGAARYAENLVIAPFCHRPSGPLHRRPAWRRIKPLVLGRWRRARAARRQVPCTAARQADFFFVVLDLLEVGIDHVVVGAALRSESASARRLRPAPWLA